MIRQCLSNTNEIDFGSKHIHNCSGQANNSALLLYKSSFSVCENRTMGVKSQTEHTTATEPCVSDLKPDATEESNQSYIKKSSL